MGEAEIEGLKLAFTTNRDLAEWSILVVIVGLAVEMIVLWIFAKGKWFETISLSIAVLVIVAGVYGEYHFGGEASKAAADLQRISDEKIALLVKETAEANERAKKAELEMVRLKLPRTIDRDKFAKELEGAPPAKVEIRYVVACADCESLSFWLSEALKKANWSVEPLIPITPQDSNWVRAVHSLHAQSSGITVVIDSPDKITADPKTSLSTLIRVLTQALGLNVLGFASNVQGAVDVTMPPEVTRIVVAPKA